MTNASDLVYELEVTDLGPLVGEFTAHGIWVFFDERAPAEVAEFAILHRSAPPLQPLAPGQIVEVGGERFAIKAVGAIANENVRALGHLVLKANGLSSPELPGDVCVEARPLPEPSVGMRVRVWASAGEDTP